LYSIQIVARVAFLANLIGVDGVLSLGQDKVDILTDYINEEVSTFKYILTVKTALLTVTQRTV
jgi:hypothetical protein